MNSCNQVRHKKPLIIGVDQSLASTGWCITDVDGNLIAYDLVQVSPASDPKNKKRDIPVLHPALDVLVGGGEEWLKQNKPMQQYYMAAAVRNVMTNLYLKTNALTMSENAPLHVCMEGLGFGSTGDAARSLAGLQFLLIDGFKTAINDEFTVKFVDSFVDIATPTTVKKFATGSGKATKDEMFDALPKTVKDKFLKIPKTKGRYDLTDAYWLSQYGFVLRGLYNAS